MDTKDSIAESRVPSWSPLFLTFWISGSDELSFQTNAKVILHFTGRRIDTEVFKNYLRDLLPPALKLANRIISEKYNTAAFINIILLTGNSQQNSELQILQTGFIF